jgi:hypothetical protein
MVAPFCFIRNATLGAWVPPLRDLARQKCGAEEKAGSLRMTEIGMGESMELTQRQMQIVERLVGAGFQPMEIGPFQRGLCMRKGECVALLGPVANGGLQLLVPVTFLIEGNLSVKIKRENGEVFVWKGKELEATAERSRELEGFRNELVGILEVNGEQ